MKKEGCRCAGGGHGNHPHGCGHEHHHAHGNGCGHGHGGECGCGHSHGCGGHSVTISMEDGEELECDIITVFGVAETDYIALQTVTDGELLIFRYGEDEDGGAHLDNIRSEEEFNTAFAAFTGLLEDDDFGDGGFEGEDFDDDSEGEDFDGEFIGGELDEDDRLYAE